MAAGTLALRSIDGRWTAFGPYISTGAPGDFVPLSSAVVNQFTPNVRPFADRSTEATLPNACTSFRSSAYLWLVSAGGGGARNCAAERIAKGLANHPIGIVLLARLAVDNRQQGKGLGKALLFDALSRIEEAADIVAVRAVMVHAIDEAARRFYEHFEFEPSPVDPFQLLLLLKDLRKALK